MARGGSQKAGGFKKAAQFQGMDSEDRTLMEGEQDSEAFDTVSTKSSLNARKQNPYGPQFPALDRYFKAK